MNNKMLQKEINNYLRQIQRNLPFSYKFKRNVLQNLKKGIQEYISLFPDVTMKDIVREFGTYHEIAAAYIENYPPQNNIRHDYKKQLVHIILISLATFLLFKASFCTDTSY